MSKNAQSAKKDEKVEVKTAEDYKITTNVKALSKVNDILNNFDVQDIPILTFDEEDNELSERYVSILMLQLSKNPKMFNSFFQTITKTNDDFYAMEAETYWNIAVDFFMNLPKPFKHTIIVSMKELKKQRDMVIAKNEKAMEKAVQKILKEKMKDLKIPTEK